MTFSRCHSKSQAEFALEGKHFTLKDLTTIGIVLPQERTTNENNLNKCLLLQS